ncbi:MAG: ABC-2 transporter permease [Planctomycetes bacterium]|nr:ABC-2 transporter permease [Planctomycetota bacterium]MCW8134660.1 ABC-2 transporter permease [Planctomycetota bacterium]
MGPVYARELRGYFDSLMGVGIIGAFVVVMMLLSVLLDPLGGGGDWFARGDLSMRTFFGIFPWVAAVVVPAVSMRLWSDDRRQATFELLMTLPIPTWRIALGKYFAGVTFLAAMLAATVVYPLMLSQFGEPDWAPVIGGYIACFLLGAAFVAIGLFVSGLTENQALAFFLGMLICLGIVGLGEMRGLLGDLARTNPESAMMLLVSIPVVGLGLLAAAVGRDKMVGISVTALALVGNVIAYAWRSGQAKPDDAKVSAATTPAGEAVVTTLGQISVLDHFGEIQRGVLNTNGLVFFAGLVVLFVLLNVWSLESRRYS